MTHLFWISYNKPRSVFISVARTGEEQASLKARKGRKVVVMREEGLLFLRGWRIKLREPHSSHCFHTGRIFTEITQIAVVSLDLPS